MNREIRSRTRVVGSFPDGNSTCMRVCAWLHHVAGTQWGNKKYTNMELLWAAEPAQGGMYRAWILVWRGEFSRQKFAFKYSSAHGSGGD